MTTMPHNTETTSTPLSAFSPDLDMLFGVICCLCFISGTIGNLAAFFFFKYSKNNVPHAIYKVITVADFYISLCALPSGVCYLTQRSRGWVFGSRVPCYIWGYTWNMAGRLSVFLVVVLSTTRTCLVLRPFYSIRVRVVLGVILGYFIFLLVQLILIQAFMGASVLFRRNYAECVFLTDGSQPNQADKAVYFIGYVMPFLLPMVIVFVSLGITIYAIAIKPKKRDSHTAAQAASSSRVTVTILIFTIVYSVFNIPLVFDRTLFAIADLLNAELHIYNFSQVDYYLNFTYSISVAVNSALNPWLYLWRMANFRRYLWELVRGCLPARCHNAVGCTMGSTMGSTMGCTGSPTSYRPAFKRNRGPSFETTSFIK